LYKEDLTCGHRGSPSNQTSRPLLENLATFQVLWTLLRRLCGGVLHRRQVYMQIRVSEFIHEPGMLKWYREHIHEGGDYEIVGDGIEWND